MEIEFVYEVNDDVLCQEFVSGKCLDKQRSVIFELSNLSEQSRRFLFTFEKRCSGILTSIWNEDGEPNENIQVDLLVFVFKKDIYGESRVNTSLMKFDHPALSLEEVENALDTVVKQYEEAMCKLDIVIENTCRLVEEQEANYQFEKIAWIKNYGSEHLQLASSLGYECDDIYISEKAIIEFPEFSLDKEFLAHGKIDSPSLEALVFAQELCNQGRNAEVTFIVTDDTDEREALVIRDYLGIGDLDLIKLL
jgi:hypothetical protein